MTYFRNGASRPGRRAFLRRIALAVSGIAAGLSTSSFGMDPDPDRGGQLAAAVARLVQHPESAIAIGSAYLSVKGPCTSSDLLHDISARLRRIEPGARNDGSIDELALIELIRSDFARGDVVTVDGWILSRTEAQVCALYAV